MNKYNAEELKAIFRKHGLDPFDTMFLVNEADWPQEAKDYCRTHPIDEEPAPAPDPRDIFYGYYGNDRGE